MSKEKKSASPWLSKVHEVQVARMTPEQRTSMLARAEQAQKRSKAATHAKSVELQTAGYKKSAYSALSCMHKAECKGPSKSKEHVAMAKQACDEMEEQEHHYSVDMLMAAPAMAHHAPVAVVTREEEEDGLEGLKVEPKDDETSASKFRVFEVFSEKVTKTRTMLTGAIAEALPLLPAVAVTQVQGEMKNLDSADNMGVFDRSRHWFVYDMMVKAGQNCTKMEVLSRGIHAKVTLAADNSQPECPICIEPWSANVVPSLLGCCHRVCEVCWEEWVRVCGGPDRAFCPLCRNKEFLEVVTERYRVEVEH